MLDGDDLKKFDDKLFDDDSAEVMEFQAVLDDLSKEDAL